MSNLDALTGTGTYAKEIGGVQVAPVSFVEATIATTPSVLDEEVMVLVGAEGSQLQAGPCRWEPRAINGGTLFPTRGDACLVVTGDRGHRAIVWWKPAVLPGVVVVPQVRAFHSTTQGIATGLMAVTFDSETYDLPAPGGMHAPAFPTRLVCVKAGLHRFSAMMQWSGSSATGRRLVRALLNGATEIDRNDIGSPSGECAQKLAGEYRLAVGDYVSFDALQTSGLGTLTLDAAWAAMSWVSP